jgi:hypothetical protein
MIPNMLWRFHHVSWLSARPRIRINCPSCTLTYHIENEQDQPVLTKFKGLVLLSSEEIVFFSRKRITTRYVRVQQGQFML